MIESLKTTTAGASGMAITWIEWLPVVVRVLVGLATVLYILIKAYKEYKR
tara:strand:- start:368 stop:517 length:150 start_codon:yes stop_codon:yes gene_type:complete